MANYLIIGASSGIGQEIAKQQADLGHSITATYHKNYPTLQHPNIRYHQFDVMNDISITNIIPEGLNGLVYCPGSIQLRPFERIKTIDFELDFQLQVMGAIKILQNVMPILKKSSNASVLLFSSVAAQTGFNFHSQVSISKGAIEGLTRALAAEYAPSIRVNCIAPSLTHTPLSASLLNNEQKLEANANRHPLKRVGSTQDIAHMAGFLLSENASWITGQILKVDGGISTIRM